MSYCQKFIFISKITIDDHKVSPFDRQCLCCFHSPNKENEGEKKRKDITNG